MDATLPNSLSRARNPLLLVGVAIAFVACAGGGGAGTPDASAVGGRDDAAVKRDPGRGGAGGAGGSPSTGGTGGGGDVTDAAVSAGDTAGTTTDALAMDGIVRLDGGVVVGAPTYPDLPARAGTSHTFQVMGSQGEVNFSLWLPENLKVVRGLIMNANQASAPDLPYYREFAFQNGFGVLGTNMNNNTVRAPDYPNLMNAGLKGLATRAAHPELEHAPLLLYGHSTGASSVKYILEAHPARVIAVVMSGHRYGPESEGAKKVPFAEFVTEWDPSKVSLINTNGAQEALPVARASGALFAVGLYWGIIHNPAGSMNYALPFFQRVLDLRYPKDANPLEGPVTLTDLAESQGWLGDASTLSSSFATVASFATYPGDKAKAAWMPDGYVAAMWRAYSTKSSPVTFEFLPAIKIASVADTINGTRYAAFRAGAVPVRVNVADGTSVTKVELFNGDRKLGERASAPFDFALQLEPGFYALNAIATEPGGKKHVSLLHTIYTR